MNTSSVSSLMHLAKTSLMDIYPPEEINSIVAIFFETLLNYSKIDILLHKDAQPDRATVQKIHAGIERLMTGEPVQYLLGTASFYDLELAVNPAVLIPRQETEILVDTVIRDLKHYSSLKILDIGTGSGCIAISLAKNLPNAHVTAIDISSDAIEVAQSNAKQNQVDISFLQRDMMDEILFDEATLFDCIVSNPPYVTEGEKQFMHRNVVDHEPARALYVNDEHPLVFYKAIARIYAKHLRKKGSVYVEINEQFGNETLQVFSPGRFGSGTILKDLNGKDRFIKLCEYHG